MLKTSNDIAARSLTLKDSVAKQKRKLIRKATRDDATQAYGNSFAIDKTSSANLSGAKRVGLPSVDDQSDVEENIASDRLEGVRRLYDWDYDTVDWINRNAKYSNTQAIEIDREVTINASNMKDLDHTVLSQGFGDLSPATKNLDLSRNTSKHLGALEPSATNESKASKSTVKPTLMNRPMPPRSNRK